MIIFMRREALGVKSWDLYDYVIGAWGGNLERILTIGGDEGNNGPIQPKKANRFKPVVKYLGPFHLDKGEKANPQFYFTPIHWFRKSDGNCG